MRDSETVGDGEKERGVIIIVRYVFFPAFAGVTERLSELKREIKSRKYMHALCDSFFFSFFG